MQKDSSLSEQETDSFNLQSLNISEEKREELLRLFPEVRTEGGQIDFDRLRLALGDMVDTGKERYGLNWPGKSACFKAIQTPSMGALLPAPEESVNFDTTKNLIIEGDNLEALKLLQKSYIGKVKMIYIDPPYNTGNDFIYPDNFSESLQTYLEYTGQTGEEGKRFSSNTDTDGRFHSKWLNMMYPRLYLARDLLRDDGVVFISIDDHEADNLYKLGKEIFGEENFVASISVQINPRGRHLDSFVAKTHEYVMIFAKDASNADCMFGIEKSDRWIDEYDKCDERGRYRELKFHRFS
nr:site-specific DNA-methyltransferase [Acidithiobacillus montserratensis]